MFFLSSSMKKILFLICISYSIHLNAQDIQDDAYQIRKILFEQTQAWNQHDLESFMNGYWNDDSLVFIGSRGLTYGYKTVLENYRKSYSSPEKMGELKFTIKQMTALGKDHYLVIGQWDVLRKDGNLSGHFSLTWKKIKGVWKIVADHSS